MQSKGGVLPRIFWMGKYPYATISHNIKRQISPSAFQHFSFRTSLNNILIYTCSNYQGIILQSEGEVLPRIFWLGKNPYTTIRHNIEWQISPSAFQRFSFHTSLNNISIYVWSENQGIILKWGGASWLRNFALQIFILHRHQHQTITSYQRGLKLIGCLAEFQPHQYQLPACFAAPSIWIVPYRS